MKTSVTKFVVLILLLCLVPVGQIFAQSVPTEQTITFLGGYGNQGDVDPYTEASLDGGQTWQSAYLTGYHPWGFAEGTNSWVNFDPSPFVGLNSTTDYRIRFLVPEDFTDPSMVFVIKADNRATLWVNDTYISTFDGQATGAAGDQVVAQAIKAGLNEIRLRLEDWGGWVGLNYRIDVTMTSAEDISNYVLTIEEAEEVAAIEGTLSRTPWEMNRGGGYFTQPVSGFGAIESYNQAVIPESSDPNWGPAPDPEVIGFSEYSILPGGCLNLVDYTYFQTFVNVPTGMEVTQFTIDFAGIDDGGRVTIFNSVYPDGVVVPGSYVYLGGTGTANLADYVADGQNRVVVTQVDNCPTGNNLQVARVILNGEAISADPVENTAPVADAGADQTFDCVVSDVEVSLNGSLSSDPDGDPLSYSWSLNGNVVSTDVAFNMVLGGGVHVFALTVSDGSESAVDEVVIAVNVDETAPSISAPEDVSVYANTAGGFSGSIGMPEVSDQCDANPLISNNAPQVFTLGETEVIWTATDAAGNSATAKQIVTVQRFPILVDIKPESDNNVVNLKSKGVIPVAVLTDADFDATLLDASTLLFGRGQAKPDHGGHLEDVDNDGDIDLMLHFRVQDTELLSSDNEILLIGQTVSGIPVAGSDAVKFSNGSEKGGKGAKFALKGNAPNPFNPTTIINYSIPENQRVSLKVYNIVGQQVATLVDGYQNAGNHSISFNAAQLSAGTYFYVLEAGGERSIKQMLFLK
jgi:hypothetical protein